ncbi:hypothetical protein [Halarcobacter ebronensis]|uniref:Uncharacterized protein n=1 Tax=Halarcobacter ebronensis TaxID=1462615 RepID=A0A4Q1ATQ4_9BACT|nr:hypothetical protein [Halarcobacter ebronensis]QKF82417.1 hypothetical protein AEBR_1937 [Halarcobacter ebronensis]RXK07560.1 hypothetical protein CRV07_03615 [Halarcobacter ebronensis]
MNKISVFKIVVFFVVSVLSLNADVAYQQNWNRQPLLESDIKTKAALEEFLKESNCNKVADYSKDKNLSAVVIRGLTVNDSLTSPHYEIKLYNCPTSNLTYEGNMLGCGKNNWAGTYYILEDGTCN